MGLTNKQKAFLEFIPVSQVRRTVLQMYALILFLVPLMVSYYFKKVNGDCQWWKAIVLFDVILIIASIPVLIKPKALLGVFHLMVGFTAGFVSVLLFIAFIIETNSVHQLDPVNLVFSLIIYLIAVFAENFMIVRANFLKYSRSSNKVTLILVLSPIIGMLIYNLLEKTFKINGMAIAAFLLAISVGIPIHSLYRGYIILKYKYRPSDL